MIPSDIIREIAAHSTAPEIKKRLEAFAAALDAQHNNQNGQWTIVLGQLENTFIEELRAVRFDFTQEMGNSEARENKILEMLEQLQADVRGLQAREVGDGT